MDKKEVIKEKDLGLYETKTEDGYKYSTREDFMYFFKISYHGYIELQNGMRIPFDQIEDISAKSQYEGYNLQIIKKGAVYFLFPIVIYDINLVEKTKDLINSKIEQIKQIQYKPKPQSYKPPPRSFQKPQPYAPHPTPGYPLYQPMQKPSSSQKPYPSIYPPQGYSEKKGSKAFVGLFIVSIVIGLMGIGLIAYDMSNFEEIDEITLNSSNNLSEIEFEVKEDEIEIGYTNLEITPLSGEGRVNFYLCEKQYSNITDIRENAIFFKQKEFNGSIDELADTITVNIDEASKYYLYCEYEQISSENELELNISITFWGLIFLIGFIMAIFAAGMFFSTLILYFAARN